MLLAPTPFIIGITSEFTIQKNLRKLPNDIWEIEIDSAVINPPTGSTLTELPNFPEPEGKILRYHLKQVISHALFCLELSNIKKLSKSLSVNSISLSISGIGQYCHPAY